MIACYDACGKRMPDAETVLAAGWIYLQGTGRWRCGSCVRALVVAGSMPGTTPAEPFVDLLPPGSRGALPKATAGSIRAPEVKP